MAATEPKAVNNDAASVVPPAATILSSTEQFRATLRTFAENTKPSLFTLRTRALKGGSTDQVLSATPNQWVQIKCYASGGENALHAHLHEDHTFVVLQGEALFRGPHGEEVRLVRYRGITIPKGNYYSFNVVSSDNLVMLRFASPDHLGDPLARVDAQGRDLDAFVEQAEALGKTRTPTVFDAFDLFD
jgi:mannose-6-phosphate isomerase-like protein (cupin superfamily)